MTKHAMQIEKMDAISKLADEILYLKKSQLDLKQLAAQYANIIRANIDTILYFNKIRQELAESLEKKNFNIANAAEKIDAVSKLIPKLTYIRSSFLGYDHIADTELRKKIDLDNFKYRIKQQIQVVRIADIDGLYSEVADKYNQLNLSGQQLNTIRSKYDNLRGMILANNQVLCSFPKIHKELNDFSNALDQHEAQVDQYISSFNGDIARLSELLSHVSSYESVPVNDTRVFPVIVNTFYKSVKRDLTLKDISSMNNASGTYIFEINSKLDKLRQIRVKLASLNNLISANKQHFYPVDYNAVVQDYKEIDAEISVRLNPNFESANAMLAMLEKKVNDAIGFHQNKSTQAAQLLNFMHANKNNFWKEDHAALMDTIDKFSRNAVKTSAQQLETDMRSRSLNKQNAINGFVQSNSYLITSAKKNEYIRNNFFNAFVNKSDFDLYVSETLKNKGFKIFLYKLKDALARFWSFLTRPQTLKVAAILVVVGLSLVFIFSHWQQILIGIGIIFIIGYFIKR